VSAFFVRFGALALALCALSMATAGPADNVMVVKPALSQATVGPELPALVKVGGSNSGFAGTSRRLRESADSAAHRSTTPKRSAFGRQQGLAVTLTDFNDKSFYAEVRRKVLVGCGALCDDTIIGAPGPFFNFVQKPVDCRALFSNTDNDAPSPRWPPPKGMPAVMKDDFTMHGQAEIMYQYEQNKYAGGQAAENVWTKEDIDRQVASAKAGTLEGTYGLQETKDVIRSIREACAKHDLCIKGLHVMVIGSERPWLEAVLLAEGAGRVTTVEYGSITSKHPQVQTMLPSELRAKFLGGTLEKFDAVATFSSVEHSGLGRYGDTLNPWGDIQAMAKAWCVTKEQGPMFVGVMPPVDPANGPDAVQWNAHRRYGKLRWAQMMANWRQVAQGYGYQRVHAFRRKSVNGPDVLSNSAQASCIQRTTPAQPNVTSPRSFVHLDSAFRRRPFVFPHAWQPWLALHEHELSDVRRQPRLVVYACCQSLQDAGCGGVGDRLTGISNAFYVAMLTGRAFAINWGTPMPLEDYLQRNIVNWYFRNDTIAPSTTVQDLNFMNELQSPAAVARLIDVMDNSSDVLWFRGNVDMFASLVDHPYFEESVRKYRLREVLQGGSWFHYAIRSLFMPANELASALDGALGQVESLAGSAAGTVPKLVSVHARLGDHLMKSGKEGLRGGDRDKRYTLNCARCAMQQGLRSDLHPTAQGTVVFVSSDADAGLDQMRALYPTFKTRGFEFLPPIERKGRLIHVDKPGMGLFDLDLPDWTCSIFGCACQGMSDLYGASANEGFGCAPRVARDWWGGNGCSTKHEGSGVPSGCRAWNGALVLPEALRVLANADLRGWVDWWLFFFSDAVYSTRSGFSGTAITASCRPGPQATAGFVLMAEMDCGSCTTKTEHLKGRPACATLTGASTFEMPAFGRRQGKTSSLSEAFPFLSDPAAPGDYCARQARGGQSEVKGSQFSQDAFLYMNFFEGKHNGVYLDIGANDPEHLSNTFFFEKCLGWTGVCMEPHPMYAQRWKTQRRCKHLPNCAWKEAKTMNFAGGATGGTMMKDTGSWQAQCISVDQMLTQQGITKVDLVSLDIEGAEIETLSAFPFHKYDIDVWIVETFWLDHRTIDKIFMDAGYAKVAQLSIDSVYKKLPQKVRYPASETMEWPAQQQYMAKMRKKCYGGKQLVQCQ
jgi:FkbM family methyltransferase